MTTKNDAKWLPKRPQNRQKYSPETKPKNKPKIYAKMLPKWLPKGLQNGSKIALKKGPESNEENTPSRGHRPVPGEKSPAQTLIRIYVGVPENILY